jgi:hypothetical protein
MAARYGAHAGSKKAKTKGGSVAFDFTSMNGKVEKANANMGHHEGEGTHSSLPRSIVHASGMFRAECHLGGAGRPRSVSAGVQKRRNPADSGGSRTSFAQAQRVRFHRQHRALVAACRADSALYRGRHA